MKLFPRLFFIILLFTIFSIIVFPGYEVFISDQEIYLPMAYNNFDENLFSNDFALRFDVLQYSFFDELIGFLLRFTSNISYILFFIYALARFIYFYALYRIVLHFTDDEKFSILSLLLFIPPISVYGTQVFDNYLIPRVMGFSLGLLSLYYLFEKKYFKSTILLSLYYLIHPLTALFFLAIYYLNLLFDFGKRKFFNKELVILGLIPIGAFLLSSFVNGPGLGFFVVIDDVWNSVIMFRWQSFFISDWGFRLFFVLFTSILVFLIGLSEYKDNKKKPILYVLFFFPLLVSLLSIYAADILKLHFVAQLQVYRSLFFIKIFGAILFFRMGYLHVKTKPQDFLYNFFILGVVVSYFMNEDFIYPFFYAFLFLWVKRRYNVWFTKILPFLRQDATSVVFFIIILPIFILYAKNVESFSIGFFFLVLIVAVLLASITYLKKVFPFRFFHIFFIFVFLILIFIPSFSIYSVYYKDSELIESCNWIKENTTKDSVFITFPQKLSRPLRLMCHRNIFVSGREGSSSLFNRAFALEWKKRMDLHYEVYSNFSLLKSLTKDYKINHIFSSEQINSSYTLVFDNKVYYIYKIE